MLDEWGVDHQWQVRLGRYVYDFLLPGKTLVEVHGGYWHPNPDELAPELMTSRQRARLLRDIDKKHHAAECGYQLKVIWEKDIKAGRITRYELFDNTGCAGH